MMTNEELNAALHDKMSGEQDTYRKWLLQQPPEEILHHTFEYTVREDILMAVADGTIPGEQAAALLRSDSPLANVYSDFEKLETEYMAILRDCVIDRGDAEIRLEQERMKALRETPVYPHSGAYAQQNGELEQYRASNEANAACLEAIDRAIRDHCDESRANQAAVREVAEAFGYERMLHVLADAVRQGERDGQFSESNQRWARTVPAFEDADGAGNNGDRSSSARSQPDITDKFVSAARREYLLTQPLSQDEITAEAQRIFDSLKAAREPNSPSGTHFMTEISPDFLQRGGSDSQDAMKRLLPFKTLSVTTLKGRRGMYAMIHKDEKRDSYASLKKPSVRKKLQERGDAPSGSKPPEKRKAKNPEL